MHLWVICESAEFNRIRKIIHSAPDRADSPLSLVPDEALSPFIEAILSMDLTKMKKYTLWLTRLALDGRITFQFDVPESTGVRGLRAVGQPDFIWPEDAQKVQEDLLFYERNKQRLPVVARDITTLTWPQLVELLEELRGSSRNLETADDYPGAEVVLEMPPYRVFKVRRIAEPNKIFKPTGEKSVEYTGISDAQRVRALETLGLGTKWCTRGDYRGGNSFAAQYLSDGDMYVVIKNRQKYAQFNFNRNHDQLSGELTVDLTVMDVRDNPMNSHDDPELFQVIANVPGLKMEEYIGLVQQTGGQAGKEQFADHMEAKIQKAITLTKDRPGTWHPVEVALSNARKYVPPDRFLRWLQFVLGTRELTVHLSGVIASFVREQLKRPLPPDLEQIIAASDFWGFYMEALVYIKQGEHAMALFDVVKDFYPDLAEAGAHSPAPGEFF